MVTIGEKWKKLFWGCMGAVAVLVLLGLTLRVIVFFVLGLLAGCAVAVLGAAKLRCPHCGKSVRELRPDKTCPYCGKKVE